MIEPIEIVDTAVKVGLGALIAALSGFGLEAYRRRSEDAKERERRIREEIQRPVVAFVDELLVLMSRAYWEKVDGKQPDIQKLIETFREKEAMVEARLAALASEELSTHFRELDRAYSSFRVELGDGHLNEARDRMREAFGHAGKLLRVLYPSGRAQI